MANGEQIKLDDLLWKALPGGVRLNPPPKWITDRLGRAPESTPSKSDQADTPPLDLNENIERARSFLRTTPPAIEGEYGDNRTFVTACHVKDLGISQTECEILMLDEYNPRCQPPWDVQDMERMVRSAYNDNRATYQAPGADTPMAEFDRVPRQTQAMPIERASQVKPNLSTRSLVKHTLDHNALSVWYGQPNAGKSAVVLDLSFRIALGWSWMGRKTSPGAVVYLAAEGAETIRRRVHAFKVHHQIDPKLDPPFYLMPSAPDFVHGGDGAKSVVDTIDQHVKEPVHLIVIDTLNRTMGGGDENSATDMGAYIRRCDLIRQHTGAHVLIIHHAGKDKDKGARGHSSLNGAVDSAFEVQPGRVVTRKQRDHDVAGTWGFQINGERIGQDADGDAITAAVLVEKNSSQNVSSAQKDFSATSSFKSTRTKVFWKKLEEENIFEPGKPGIDLESLRDFFFDHCCEGLSEGSARRQAWKRSYGELVDRELIAESGELVTKVKVFSD